MAAGLLLALAACKTASDPGAADATNPVTFPDPDLTPVPPADPPTDAPSPPPAGWPDAADILGGWFVRTFDTAALEQVRSQERFTRQDLDFTLSPTGHPRGRLTFRGSNAFEDAGVDYAWSTGLSGAGALISIVDSRIREDHPTLAGVELSLAPGSAAHTDMHGTSVASVLAGPHRLAPGAAIHHGAISFNDTNMLPRLDGIMRDAEAKGALVSNNSWAFVRSIDESMNGSFLDGSDGRRYVSALKGFARNGVVVFAAENDHAAQSAHVMAALPVLHPDLEGSWLTAINAIPVKRDGLVVSAERISAPCLEAARWCLAANGQLRVATEGPAHTGIGTGASFSAPQVSGALALLGEAFPDLDAGQLRARLLVTADNGFFVHEGEVEFAPGLRHGYSSEWGHGFLDLRAALLPIGQALMATRSGGQLSLDRAPLTAGRAMGDALSRGLAGIELVVTDQMSADFTIAAAGIVQESPNSSADRAPLAHRLSQDLAVHGPAAGLAAFRDEADVSPLRPAARTDTAGSPVGVTEEVALLAGEETHLTAIVGERGAGLRLTRRVDAGKAGFTFGLEGHEERSSILGLSATGGGSGSKHLSLVAQASVDLGDAAVFRLDGRMGRSDGGWLGELAEIDRLAFDSVGASITVADAASTGLLTIYARRPMAVTDGAASLTLARPAAAGLVDFTPASIALAPEHRQLDIGLEYSRRVGRSAHFSAAARWTEHSGNRAGSTDGEIGIALKARF